MLQLTLIELAHYLADGVHGVEQIPIALAAIWGNYTGWLCSDEPPLLQL